MRIAGLLLLAALVIPVYAEAADLININTADASLLDSLPGIGATKAEAIIAYRDAHGPFAQIADIQNASGIGPSTYAQIAPLITVGTVTAATSSSAPAAASSTPSATTYVPSPGALAVSIDGTSAAFIHVPLKLSARVTSKNGAVDPSARVTWSFGDGSALEGTNVEKTYRYEGTYLIVATASDGATNARAELSVTVAKAQIRIVSATNEGITIANESASRLDLSGWRFAAGGATFRIPEGTIILPRTAVLFPAYVINVPVALDAILQYPDGTRAAQAPEQLPAQEAVAPAQPLAPVASYESVQRVHLGEAAARPVEPISSKALSQLHDEVRAPREAGDAASRGAIVATAAQATVPAAHASIMRSPWTWGFLGVMALAGGAFIFL